MAVVLLCWVAVVVTPLRSVARRVESGCGRGVGSGASIGCFSGVILGWELGFSVLGKTEVGCWVFLGRRVRGSGIREGEVGKTVNLGSALTQIGGWVGGQGTGPGNWEGKGAGVGVCCCSVFCLGAGIRLAT